MFIQLCKLNLYIRIGQHYFELEYAESHTSNIFRIDTTGSSNALHQSTAEIKEQNTTIPENTECEKCGESNSYFEKDWVSVDLEDENLKASYIK